MLPDDLLLTSAMLSWLVVTWRPLSFGLCYYNYYAWSGVFHAYVLERTLPFR